MKPDHSLPLNGYYSADKEITLAGTPEELRLLVSEILNRNDSQVVALSIPDDLPDPYDSFVKGIQLIHSDGPIQIAFTDNILIISGSAMGRQHLATFVTRSITKLDNNPGFIRHSVKISTCPDQPFIASSALPLIVTVVGFGPSDRAVEPKLRMPRHVYKN